MWIDRRYIDKLPDAYDKATTSNNYKLLKMNEDAIGTLYSDIEDTQNCLDLNLAFGKTLDLYGEIYKLPRNGLDDDKYRAKIVAKIASAVASGDYNGTVNAIRMVVGSDDLTLTELPEYTAVKASIPYTFLDTGISAEQVVSIIKELIPVGVTLDSVSFDGTFEFGTVKKVEYDNDKGFGNIEQTIGGSLGSAV